MAYVASLGYHELYVNGKKVDDRVLAPSISDLSQRVRYVTYDVTEHLEPGTNAVVLWCRPGWARFRRVRRQGQAAGDGPDRVSQPDGQT